MGTRSIFLWYLYLDWISAVHAQSRPQQSVSLQNLQMSLCVAHRFEMMSKDIMDSKRDSLQQDFVFCDSQQFLCVGRVVIDEHLNLAKTFSGIQISLIGQTSKIVEICLEESIFEIMFLKTFRQKLVIITLHHSVITILTNRVKSCDHNVSILRNKI